MLLGSKRDEEVRFWEWPRESVLLWELLEELELELLEPLLLLLDSESLEVEPPLDESDSSRSSRWFKDA